MRFLACLQYGSIPLLTYWGMTTLLNLEWSSDTGYTSRGTFPIGSPQLGSRKLKAVPTQQVYHQDDQEQYIHLRTNRVQQMCGLIPCTPSGPKYLQHFFHVTFLLG